MADKNGASDNGLHQGGGPETMEMIDSEDQLEAYLKASGSRTAPAGDDDPDADPDDEGQDDGKRKDPKKPTKKATAAKQVTDPNSPEFKLPESLEEGGEEEEDDEEFGNVVDYLNKEFDLKLNMAALPKEMTREQEAEAIGSIFRRLNDGVQAKLAEYEDIQGLLEDEEVAALLEAKRQGKGLRDIAAAYASDIEGATDDTVVAKHLKIMYPTLTEAELQEQIKGYKDAKRMDKMASAARDYFKAESAKRATADEEARRREAEEQELSYRQSVAQFGQFLARTEKLYDVPITKDVKQKIFQAVTARDRNGLTAHDRALQSDAGTFLSALGMFYMKQMLQSGASLKANKKLRDFKDSLFDQPDKLQSGAEGQPEPDFDANLVNRF